MMQLNPPIPVDTPRGPAYAHVMIDYSQEHYVLFVCFLCDTGDCWVLPNRDVKLQQNITIGVRLPRQEPTRTAETPAPFSPVNGGNNADGLVNRTAAHLPQLNGNAKHDAHD